MDNRENLTDQRASISFNYEAVNPLYRQNLIADAQAIRDRLRETSRALIDIGELLARARPQLPHGAWLPWLLSETGMSESWARGCIRVYKRFHNQRQLVAALDFALPPTAVVRLAYAPAAAIEDVRERVVGGRMLRVSDVETIIKRHRPGASASTRGAEGRQVPASHCIAGLGGLRELGLEAQKDLISAVVERMREMLVLLEEADARLQAGRRPNLRDLQADLRARAQWLTDGLEQITQRRAHSSTRLAHETFIERRDYEPGSAWGDAASFLRDISHSIAWERIKAADVPGLLLKGRKTLRAVLPDAGSLKG